MKKFVFRLQTALDVKIREEDRLKEKLYKARQVFDHNLHILNDLRNRLADIMNRIRGGQADRVDIMEVRQCQEFIPILNTRIKAQESVLEKCRREVEAVKQETIEVMRGRKILEKIKARHYQAYMLEYRREEQKEIDEMATTGHHQKDSVTKQGG